MGQRPHVLHDDLFAAQRRPEPVARIVSAILHDDGPLHHRADALAHASCHVRLRVPDGPERVEDVGARDLRDVLLTQRREGVARQAREPIAAVLGMAPAGCSWVQTRSAASAKVGQSWARRFSASGSPPARASQRLARALARASWSETTGKPPTPSSRPRMAIR